MTPLWTAPHLEIASGGQMRVRFAANGVAIDTRRLAAGDLFVALLGENGDGHDHVLAALAQGAAGVMVHRDVPGLPDDAKVLRVDDTLAALRRLGGFARGRFTGRLVAITGSVGKTTTKEMLRAILSPVAATHVAEASYNNHWGLPLTLARLPDAAAFCVVEIGMNHAGEIAPLARLARPHVAIITAIEKAHVGILGSLAAIAAEKATILQGLEPRGTAILPRGSPFLPILAALAHGAHVLTFGASDLADARLLECESDAEGSDILARIAGVVVRLRLNAPGAHMAIDALAALTAAAALGIDPQAAADNLAAFTPVTGRGARRTIVTRAGGEALLLDESYNASAPAVRAALAVLKLQPARRRIVVLGDMLELGDDAVGEHEDLVPDVADTADLLFTCGTLTRALFDAIPPGQQGAHAETAGELAPLVVAALAAGDAILVKGSLGMRMKLIIDALTRPAGAAA